MLSIFACPKPFTDPHTAIIQRNAITSWTLLRPRPEIILFGDEEGTERICQDLDLRYAPEVRRNEFGTPLLNDLFAKASQIAGRDLLCYVNADIILMSDFMKAAQEVRRWRRTFLMVGRRGDLPLREPWDFTAPNWEARLREHAPEEFRLREQFEVDYFCFRKGLYDGGFPSLAVGRGCLEGWLIFRPRAIGCPVVDVSRVAVVIHQNHDYSHLSYAAPHVENWQEREFWKRISSQLVEFRSNKELCDSASPIQFGLFDATHVLTSRGIRLALGREYLTRHFETMPVLHPSLATLVRVARALARITRPIRRAVRPHTQSTPFSSRRDGRSRNLSNCL